MTNQANSLDLLDLIDEGKKARRETVIKKAAARVADAASKQPLENGPPIRRDVYQQLEWRALSVTLVTHTVTCRSCSASFETPNPTIFIERYHRRHGRHLVEAHNFNLLPRKEIESLPRKLETHYTEALYCHHCFLSQQEPLCLTQEMIPLQQTQQSSPHSCLPCVPQEWAIPSLQRHWFATSDPTSLSTKPSSELSEPSKPTSKARYY